MARIDLNAARAEVRAAAEDHTVELGDDTFTFPPLSLWPWEALLGVRDGEYPTAIRLVLNGDADKFLAHDLALADFDALFDALSAVEGVGDRGNSRASSRSSKTTGKK